MNIAIASVKVLKKMVVFKILLVLTRPWLGSAII